VGLIPRAAFAREWPKSKRARLLFLVGVTPAKQQLPMTPIYLRFKFWQLPILAILAISHRILAQISHSIG